MHPSYSTQFSLRSTSILSFPYRQRVRWKVCRALKNYWFCGDLQTKFLSGLTWLICVGWKWWHKRWVETKRHDAIHLYSLVDHAIHLLFCKWWDTKSGQNDLEFVSPPPLHPSIYCCCHWYLDWFPSRLPPLYIGFPICCSIFLAFLLLAKRAPPFKTNRCLHLSIQERFIFGMS